MLHISRIDPEGEKALAQDTDQDSDQDGDVSTPTVPDWIGPLLQYPLSSMSALLPQGSLDYRQVSLAKTHAALDRAGCWPLGIGWQRHRGIRAIRAHGITVTSADLGPSLLSLLLSGTHTIIVNRATFPSGYQAGHSLLHYPRHDPLTPARWATLVLFTHYLIAPLRQELYLVPTIANTIDTPSDVVRDAWWTALELWLPSPVLGWMAPLPLRARARLLGQIAEAYGLPVELVNIKYELVAAARYEIEDARGRGTWPEQMVLPPMGNEDPPLLTPADHTWAVYQSSALAVSLASVDSAAILRAHLLARSRRIS